MTTLVLGATGATGRWLVRHLLERGETVRVIVRDAQRLPDEARGHERLQVTQASLLDLPPPVLDAHVTGCDAVASCLGHNLTFRGVFGSPRRLVTDAIGRVCQAIVRVRPAAPVKLVVMSTVGVRDPRLIEPRSLGEQAVFALVRCLLPPHVDNERAADFLRLKIGTAHRLIQWVLVRPDGLVDADTASEVTWHPSPIRSPVFNSGTTSRINVADAMARLVTNVDQWAEWRGRMPVVYNADPA